MEPLQSFREALTAFEHAEAEMLRTMKRTDAAWQKDYIQLRRQLQAHLTAAGVAARRCPEINGNPAVASRFDETLARLRSALAVHQTNWPAISIDLKDPVYRESVRKVRAASLAFTTLAREILERGAEKAGSGRVARAP
jgi:hypothetical protein